MQEQTLLDTLTEVEKLIILQLVYERGATDWPALASFLSKHPLLQKPSAPLTAQTISRVYSLFLRDASIDESSRSQELAKPKSSVNLSIAKKQYISRLAELRGQLIAEENKFKTLAREIQEIKAGKWDDHLEPEEVNTGDKEKRPKTPISKSSKQGKQVEQTSSEPTTAAAKETTVTNSTTPSIKTPSVDTAFSIPRQEPSHEKSQEITAQDDDVDAKDDTDDADVQERLLGSNDANDDESIANKETSEALPETVNTTTKSNKVKEEGDNKPSSPANTTTETAMQPTSQNSSSTKEKKTETEKRKRKRGAADKSDISHASKQGNSSENASPTIPASEMTRSKRTKTEDTADSSINELTDKERANIKRLQRAILQIHSQISELSAASPFREPVRTSDAPSYFKVIKRPMDLKTIGRKIREGHIVGSDELRRDVLLIFANAIMFNRSDSELAKRAHEMAMECERLISVFDAAELSYTSSL